MRELHARLELLVEMPRPRPAVEVLPRLVLSQPVLLEAPPASRDSPTTASAAPRTPSGRRPPAAPSGASAPARAPA
eukprot:scaffold87061_cov69-Phaeocystis_antarctica.AAC.1